MKPCPEEERVIMLLCGELDASDVGEVENHLAQCSQCQQVAEEFEALAAESELSDEESPNLQDTICQEVLVAASVADAGNQRMRGRFSGYLLWSLLVFIGLLLLGGMWLKEDTTQVSEAHKPIVARSLFQVEVMKERLPDGRLVCILDVEPVGVYDEVEFRRVTTLVLDSSSKATLDDTLQLLTDQLVHELDTLKYEESLRVILGTVREATLPDASVQLSSKELVASIRGVRLTGTLPLEISLDVAFVHGKRINEFTELSRVLCIYGAHGQRSKEEQRSLYRQINYYSQKYDISVGMIGAKSMRGP